MYLCNSFKKYKKYIYIIYILCSILSYNLFGKHQDGRLALIWILFILLAIIHFLEDIANKYFKFHNNVYVYIGLSILFISALYYIFTNPIQLYTSITSSMEPTIYPKNIMVINRMAYRSRKPQRNDIVLIKLDFGTIPAAHRILACPNDTVRIKDRIVTVNGKRMEFSAIYPAKPETIVLPKGAYFHKGDNPNSYYDIVYSDQILGKLIYVLGGKPN